MTDWQTRVPPQNAEAERSLIGACLLDPAAYDAAKEVLRDARDFYLERHQLIWEAIERLRKRREPADLVTVTEELRRADQLEEAGGLSYLSDLVRLVPTTANAGAYATIVADLAIRRRAIRRAAEAIDILFRPGDVDLEEVAFLLSTAVEDGTHNLEMETIGQIARRRVGEIRARPRGEVVGVTTGFRKVDTVLGGLEPKKLYIVAARPAMGKSGFVQAVIKHAARATGDPWALFGLEMSADAYADRAVLEEAMVDPYAYRTNNLNEEGWRKVESAIERLADVPYYVFDTPSSVQDIHRAAAAVRRKHGKLGGIAIDYMQLLTGAAKRASNRTEEVGEISRQVKRLGTILDCPVLAVSQLSRDVERRNDKRPQLSDLRESGQIEQDAHAVIFLYRDEYYNPKTEFPGLVEVIIAKNRDGRIGTRKLRFIPEWVRFENVDELGGGNRER